MDLVYKALNLPLLAAMWLIGVVITGITIIEGAIMWVVIKMPVLSIVLQLVTIFVLVKMGVF